MMSDRGTLVILVLAPALLLVLGSIFLLLREAGRQDLETRVATLAAGGRAGPASRESPLVGVITSPLGKIGEAVRKGTRLYSVEGLAELEGIIEAGGMEPKRIVPVVLGGKMFFTFSIPVAAFAYCSFAGMSLITCEMAVAAALPLGVLGPDWILRWLRKGYRKALRRGVSDALDLLVVCTEAGMGLESALERVAGEMYASNRPMAASLTRLVDELKVLPNRHDALRNFGARAGVPGIRRMGTILSQTLQYGSPLGQALRAVASELRRERITRLEEKAIRLPSMLIFPLIFFILPAFFIVMAGGPILRLFELLNVTNNNLPG